MFERKVTTQKGTAKRAQKVSTFKRKGGCGSLNYLSCGKNGAQKRKLPHKTCKRCINTEFTNLATHEA
ncbi:hypothetical protein IscW_ISCW024212 [Ixodes scapularis]|uniref:Uncharacterized protein n=1 Tax=Ixodes scapularis TaxID=6945 RepID=B7PK85_IXOSC|nr:hypothetical protein IscW_ISCW024212 [Ixodes scapularis]|eukprot:XP_002409690.1 hypothetical protein IscW_ISCW024212 [Ixodes scapularis]